MPGLSPLAAEFSGASQGVDFGYLPRLKNLPTISISAWFYRTADTVTFTDVIASQGADYGGWILGTTPNREITYYQKATPGNAGEWSSPDNAYSLNAWTHVLVTRNNSSAANLPVMYINGAAVVVTQDVAQIGTNPDETASHFMIGNTKTKFVDMTVPFHGKIFDTRIYNVILVQADDTRSTNLLFQAFAVRTEKLASLTDTNLNGLKLFDAQALAAGAVIGNVTGRAAP
jgi:hypothetical protein